MTPDQLLEKINPVIASLVDGYNHIAQLTTDQVKLLANILIKFNGQDLKIKKLEFRIEKLESRISKKR